MAEIEPKTFGMRVRLCQLNYVVRLVRICDLSESNCVMFLECQRYLNSSNCFYGSDVKYLTQRNTTNIKKIIALVYIVTPLQQYCVLLQITFHK